VLGWRFGEVYGHGVRDGDEVQGYGECCARGGEREAGRNEEEGECDRMDRETLEGLGWMKGRSRWDAEGEGNVDHCQPVY